MNEATMSESDWGQVLRDAAPAGDDYRGAVGGIARRFALPAQAVRFGCGWSVWFALPTGRRVRVWSAGDAAPDVADCRAWAVEREIRIAAAAR